MTLFDPYLRHSVRDSETALRDAGPIVWSETAQAWLVTRYSEVGAVLSDSRFEAFQLHEAFARLMDRAGIALPHLRRFLEASLIFKAGPDHLALRRLLSRTLNSQALQSIASWMGELAEGLWTDCVNRGECDLVRDYAEELPSLAISRILGLGEDERRSFFDATYGLMGVYNRACPIGRYREFDQRLCRLRGVVDALFEDRRRTARGDGLARFLEESRILGLSDDAAAASLVFLYLASVDQTSALIALAIRKLALSPQLAHQARAGTLDCGALVEELLRIESPAPQAIRVATADLEIGNAKIAAGDMLVLLLSSANHDADHFPEPHRVATSPRRHLAFSQGAHACIGAAFARLEVAAALLPAIARPPTLIDDVPVQWWPLDATRRLRTLRVCFA